MTVRAETQIDLARVDDGAAGQNGATFTPSVDAAGDISWTNDKGLPNPATQNIKGPAGSNGYTPYIQGGYWYINGTSTGVKAEGEDGTTSVWYYGDKITGTSTTPTVFSGSGIANAVVGDMYLNTETSNVYQCTLGGNASTAKWVYAGTIADGVIRVKTESGSVATFADASEYPALDLITDINPTQSGSGTPSPNNVRAISGSTEVNTYVNDTHTTTGADTYTTPLGRTVYGGTLDVTNGTLTVKYGKYTVTENETFTDRISSQNRVYFQLTEMASTTGLTDDLVLCNRLPKASPSSSSTTPEIVVGYSSNYIYLQGLTAISGVTDLASFKTWLESNPVEFTYELATQQVYSVTPQQIMMLQGTNYVWTDTGDVSVQYAIIADSAVDALREPISNASKTATSYITAIDQGGIKVHDASDMDNYAKIDSTGMQIYQDNNEVASFGANTIKLGETNINSVIELCDAAGKISANRSGGSNELFITSQGTSSFGAAYATLKARSTQGFDNSYIQLFSSNQNHSYISEIKISALDTVYGDAFVRINPNEGAYFSTSGYSNNQAQLHVSSDDISSTGHIWLGIGDGGVNHGIYSVPGSFWIVYSDGTYNYTQNNFGPYETSTSSSTGYYLGWNAQRWRGGYGFGAWNSSSDKKNKDVIGDLDFAKDLIMGLKPVEFQWKGSDHKRSHMGLIAQDSAEVAKELGKDLSFYEANYNDGTAYHGEEVDDKELSWGMMYAELIAPLIKVVQEQQKEIDELKTLVNELIKEKK